MIECPNCGTANAPDRAFCAICGERLTAPEAAALPPPAPGQGDVDLSWLLADTEAAPPASGKSAAPPAQGEPELDWLLQSLAGEQEESPAPPAATPPAIRSLSQPEPQEAVKPPTATSAFLPAWLQGAEMEVAPVEPKVSEEWDEGLDFSDLPGWSQEEEELADGRRAGQPPVIQPLGPDDPIHAAESMGSGLLAGVRGPIPIEPVITLSHEAPAFPERTEVQQYSEAANLFAQIAGGAVLPEPVALPKAPPRGVAFFYLVLLLLIILTLLLNLSIFGPPPLLPAALDFAQTIDALPAGSRVLVAFDYEGGMLDELEPGAIATLNHLHAVAGQTSNQLALLSVSTTPQGSALAERAWQRSAWPETSQPPLAYLPGGSIGLRALLAESLMGEEDAPSVESVSLIIVIATETTDIQRWIEQVGSQTNDIPVLAVAPAAAETSLTPYLASGQLDGMLAGVPGTASYEYYGTKLLGVAWRRIDAVTVGALLVLVVIVAGNIAATVQRARAAREAAQDA